MQISGIVLAGGKGTRLRADKAWADLGGKPLVLRVIEAIRPVVNEIVVVTNEPEKYAKLDVRTVRDTIPGEGPLIGLQSGLKAVRNPWAFVATCDMPFLTPDFVYFLLRQTTRFDAVVPGDLKTRYPLSAMYAKACVPAIEHEIGRGRREVVSFFENVRVRWIPINVLKKVVDVDRVLFDVDTPEDLEKAKGMLKSS
ncbi:MAG TPA: molybdenum cofactor guanylyltransferase [Candidatus Thermoplasmatota archaeon]|nr:molybdenum cofactor guanylyltransferase [Candidatus Thermoplasmatota archaeon]